jgi:DNA-binding MarR family transcriptional regulator
VDEQSVEQHERPAAETGEGEREGSRAEDAALRQAIELLFFAYRDFTQDADALLARYGFGRAHHRVIYFVGRLPGITVGELLVILKITKQSLARVLGQLMREGFVTQRACAGDRRRRHLYLTVEAEALERTLTDCQAARIRAAWTAAGDDAARGFRAVLRAMINPHDRDRFDDCW